MHQLYFVKARKKKDLLPDADSSMLCHHLHNYDPSNFANSIIQQYADTQIKDVYAKLEA